MLSYGGLRLDQAARRAGLHGRALRLTRTEFELLHHLLRHARQVLTREQLMAQVWTGDELPSANALEAHIVQLRRKTEAGGGPRLIRTVRGVGYVLGARA
ncbi:winged helix-turn-helix domain-containing protein [Streptomyces inhibens]